MSLFLGQVYQRSRPEEDSLSLMKGEGLSENSEVGKYFVLRSKVLSFKSPLSVAVVVCCCENRLTFGSTFQML